MKLPLRKPPALCRFLSVPECCVWRQRQSIACPFLITNCRAPDATAQARETPARDVPDESASEIAARAPETILRSPRRFPTSSPQFASERFPEKKVLRFLN